MKNDTNNKESNNTSALNNALAIAANEIFGVSHLTKLTIVVEGTQIKHYKHFTLSQTASGHHNFTLVLAHDSLGTPEDHHMEKAQKLMGKRILVIFSYKNVLTGSPERDFIGVVTKVGHTRAYGNHGHIVLKGSSPTVLLDAAPHIQSFGGSEVVSLSSVAHNIIKEGLGEKYNYRVEPKFSNNMAYTCQYDETHYNYLARIAATYGEQFYYDGTMLHFGKLPSPEKAIPLTFGKDVEEVEIEMRALHVNRVMYGYNSSDNELLTTGQTRINHQGSLAKAAYAISEKTFQTPSLCMAPLNANTSKDVEFAQEASTGSQATNVFVTSGKTTVPFLYPGCLVDMNMRKAASKETSFLTRLIITKIEHTVDELGHYIGQFEAVAEGSGYLPTPEYKKPIPEPQIATVVDNNDSQGRVQVKFDWQINTTTQWIRVMSPDAGSSDKVSKNRGFVAIPEIGDQVMIGFMLNKPDSPYVMGGLFHGKAGSGGGESNNVKSLSSKSGHTIELNDAGGITTKDRSGNSVILSGEGDITTKVSNYSINNIGAKHTVCVGAEEEGEDAEATLNMDADGNITLEGKTEIVLKVGENSISITKGGITISCCEDSGFLMVDTEGDTSLDSQKSISIISTKKMSIESSNDDLSIKGTQVDIN